MTEESGKESMNADEIAVKARRLLDDDAAAVDGATASRLHRMRSEAVQRRRSIPAWGTWAGAGAAAASFATVAVYFSLAQPEPLPAIYQDPVQQAAASDIELMDELDFVAWLVLQEGENADVIDQT